MKTKIWTNPNQFLEKSRNGPALLRYRRYGVLINSSPVVPQVYRNLSKAILGRLQAEILFVRNKGLKFSKFKRGSVLYLKLFKTHARFCFCNDAMQPNCGLVHDRFLNRLHQDCDSRYSQQHRCPTQSDACELIEQPTCGIQLLICQYILSRL